MSTVYIDDINVTSVIPEALKATRLHLRFTRYPIVEQLEPLLTNTNLRCLSLRHSSYEHLWVWAGRLIERNPKLHSLSLCFITHTLLEAMSHLKDLRKLRLKDGILSTCGIEMLTTIIQTSVKLRHLDLGQIIFSQDRSCIFDAIASHSRITYLATTIGCSTDFDNLKKVLVRNKHLTHLKFANSSRVFGDEGFKYCVDHNHPHLTLEYRQLELLRITTEMDLPQYDLNSYSCLEFSMYTPPVEIIEGKFAHLDKLTELVVSFLDDDSAPSLMRLLDLNPYISHVTIYVVKDTAYLCEFMAKLSNVTHLRVHMTRCPDKLITCLFGHTNLQYLSLKEIRFTDAEYTSLDLVKSMPNLIHYATSNSSDDVEPTFAAKYHCRLRKTNRKTFERTLVGRLLRTLDDM